MFPLSLSLASSIPVLGLERVCPRKGCPWPWPRIFFVSLALDFFCVLGLGLEPCVLDSTSGCCTCVLSYAKMLKETIETIVFFVTFLSLVAFQLGKTGSPAPPLPWLRLCFEHEWNAIQWHLNSLFFNKIAQRLGALLPDPRV